MNGNTDSQNGTIIPYTFTTLLQIGEFVGWEFALIICAAVHLYFIGNIGLPVAHYYYDGTAIRDTGTMLSYLLSQPEPLTALLKASFGHIEGPLQYGLLNIYCYVIGDFLPLTPSTMQFPNTVFSVVAASLMLLIGLELFSRRTAFYCVAAFILGPWLAATIREPWYFNTLSSALQCSTVYFCLRYFLDPQDGFYRATTLVSLGLYTLTGMDWPSFGAFLLAFFVLSSARSRQPLVRDLFLGNRLWLFPFSCATVLLVVSVYLWTTHGFEGCAWSRIGHPFCVFMECMEANNLSRIVNNTLLPWGPQMLLAFAGTYWFYGRSGERKTVSNHIQVSLLDSMCLWLVTGAVAVLVSSGDSTYLYILALPSAMLSGLALSKMRSSVAISLLVFMAFFQIYVVSSGRVSFTSDKKERILAAACFLIEQRPDLVSGKAKPFVSEGDALPIISYMRAGTRSILIPTLCSTKAVPPNFSDGRLVSSLEGLCSPDQEPRNPWFILDTQILVEANAVDSPWLRIIEHPDVRWIARFRDGDHREIAIGEFCENAGVPLSRAPFMDVSSLAATYLEKYDRISFLKSNVEFLRHY